MWLHVQAHACACLHFGSSRFLSCAGSCRLPLAMRLMAWRRASPHLGPTPHGCSGYQQRLINLEVSPVSKRELLSLYHRYQTVVIHGCSLDKLVWQHGRCCVQPVGQAMTCRSAKEKVAARPTPRSHPASHPQVHHWCPPRALCTAHLPGPVRNSSVKQSKILM